VEKLLLDQVVRTDYGQFDLVWTQDGGFDGDFDRVFAGQVNGLVGAADPDGVYINLGRQSGGPPVRIVLMDEPAMDDPSWEDVVEVSFVLPKGHEMQRSSWAGANRGTLEGLPPGSYRLRVSATGRDPGHAGESPTTRLMPISSSCGQHLRSQTSFCGQEARTDDTGTAK
jgi:hypothetical protein